MDHFHGHDVAFMPYNYNDPPLTTAQLKVDKLIIVDFSFRGEEMEDLLVYCNTNDIDIIIIDHHETVKDEMMKLERDEEYDNVDVVFDTGYSGAMLTWRFFHGMEVPPYAVTLTQDRDLWTFDYKDSKPFHAATRRLRMHTKEDIFRYWVPLLNDEDAQKMLDTGKIIWDYLQDKITAAVKVWKENPVYISIQGIRMPVINNTDGHITSDLIGELALLDEAEHGCACGYFDTHTHRVFNLRSRGDVSVGNICKNHGGGGHPNAAGFSMELPLVTGVMTERMFEQVHVTG